MPKNLLKQKNSYFRNLSSDAKEVFIARLYNFLEDKQFVGKEGLVITDEIKVLISASAVQLTFGLKDYLISHLHTINVFPRVFYSKLLNANLKGLNTQNGVLSISWDDFKEGHSTDSDGINLGLHELTHALYIDLDEDGNNDEHFSAYFAKWEMIAQKDFLELKQKKNTFLRSYGGTNMHEFFAVCVEHFFEAPKEFKNELPHLYNFLMLMLNQDPSNTNGDYKVSVLAPKEISVLKNNSRSTDVSLAIDQIGPSVEGESFTFFKMILQRHGIYIAMAATFLGLFLGIPLLIWFWSTTVVSIGVVFVMLFFCGSLGLLQWKFVRDFLEMEYHQFSMYAFSGFGMCLINIIFCLNMFIPIRSSTTIYEIVSINNANQGLDIILLGEGNNPALERNVASYLYENFENVLDAKKVEVSINTGLFGLNRIEDCKLIN